jgi:hypothetical protein
LLRVTSTNRFIGTGVTTTTTTTRAGGQNFLYDATGQQARASYTGYTLQQSYDADRLRVKKVANGTVTFNLRSSVLGGQIEAQQVASGHDPKLGDRLPIQEMKITMGLSNILGTMGLGVRAVWAWVFAK